jgi:glucose-1-phosphate cytidylyltransferase
MKCIVLAGGRGQRLETEAGGRPKALVEVAGEPLLRHVLRHLAEHGLTEFVVAAGYRCEEVRRAAARWQEWEVLVADTGVHTATGGRLKRLYPLVVGERAVLITYCDGLTDLDIGELTAFHRSHGRAATLAAARPPSGFGWLDLEGDRCVRFIEKPPMVDAWINGGYFVVDPAVLASIEGDGTSWERGPVPELAARGELMAYRHHGFWMCVDTPKDLAAAEAALAGRRRRAVASCGAGERCEHREAPDDREVAAG